MWQNTYDWLKQYDALAAWFQGIGSIVAIVAAFVIAQAQTRSARKVADEERRRRAKSLAIILLPDIRLMKKELEDENRKHLPRIEMPPGLVSRIDHLYLLEEAGNQVLRAIVACEDETAQLGRMGVANRNIKGDFGRWPLRQTAIAQLESALSKLANIAEA